MSKQMAAILFGMTFTMIAFQNCGEGFKAAEIGVANAELPSSGRIDQPGGGMPGSPAPAAKACMKDGAFNLATSLVNPPAIRTGFSSLYRRAAAGGIPATTALTLYSTSECISRGDLTTGGRCPATPACVPHRAVSVNLTLTCSNTNSATTCANFASNVNTNINVADAYNVQQLVIAVVVDENVCDRTGTQQTLYVMPYLRAPQGTMRIQNTASLAAGTPFSVQLTGVRLEKNGDDTTNTITLNGTYAGEIVNIVTCTP